MSIYKKLFDAKKEIGKITKDSKNPFFKSNYLSLNGLIDAVEEVLVKHDLLLLQPICDGKVITRIIDTSSTTLNIDTNSVDSEICLPNIQDPQKLGSAITYYRRYTLQSLLGLQAEDDDGNTATKYVNKPKQLAPTKQPLTPEGFMYLKDKGTKSDIEKALKDRTLTKIQEETLNKLKDGRN